MRGGETRGAKGPGPQAEHRSGVGVHCAPGSGRVWLYEEVQASRNREGPRHGERAGIPTGRVSPP